MWIELPDYLFTVDPGTREGEDSEETEQEEMKARHWNRAVAGQSCRVLILSETHGLTIAEEEVPDGMAAAALSYMSIPVPLVTASVQ